MRSFISSSRNPKDQNSQPRENPYYWGLLRGKKTLADKIPTLNSPGNVASCNIFRSVSHIPNVASKEAILVTHETVNNKDTTVENSVVVLALERSPSKSPPNILKNTSLACQFISSDFMLDLDSSNNAKKISSPKDNEENQGQSVLPGTVSSTVERSSTVNKRKQKLSMIPRPQSAASFYNGYSSPIDILKPCESIKRLNLFLKSRRDDVNAGVPEYFLHAVIGPDVSDVGSTASAIMYAFYLNETLNNNQFCTVPIINMKREDLSFHAELKWLLDSCQINQSAMIFADEIDLSYYDQFGSLKVVLVNGSTLSSKQEGLKEAVIEILNCREGDSVYPWVENVTARQDCSCCTVIAEKFAVSSPEILAGQGISRLLLGGILLDTGNLTHPRCTFKDKYMATMLINGAGRYGCNGLFEILRFKMYDVSDLKVVDILRKDFKMWASAGNQDTRLKSSHIGMSSIGISIGKLLSHKNSSTQDIKRFQQLEGLRLLVIVSGYHDAQKTFRREILFSAESVEQMVKLLSFLNLNDSQLSLQVMHRPGLKDEMRVYEIDKFTPRKTIERLLEEFGEAFEG